MAIRVTKLEKKIEEMSATLEKNNKLFEQLIEILRPAFPRETSANSALEINQTTDNGKKKILIGPIDLFVINAFDLF